MNGVNKQNTFKIPEYDPNELVCRQSRFVLIVHPVLNSMPSSHFFLNASNRPNFLWDRWFETVKSSKKMFTNSKKIDKYSLYNGNVRL